MTDIAQRPLQTYYKKLYIKSTFEKSAWFMQKYDMTILAYESAFYSIHNQVSNWYGKSLLPTLLGHQTATANSGKPGNDQKSAVGT